MIIEEVGGSALVFYEPDFLHDPDSLLETLMIEVDWEHRQMSRRECWMNPLGTPYIYGHYGKEQICLPREYHPSVAELAIALCKVEIDVDACFLARYDDQHHHHAWHADDHPEIDTGRPIVLISLGAERDIMFRRKGETAVETLTLASGSILIMGPGMQTTHEYCVPKHPRPCAPHISLTYRGLVPSAGWIQ